MGSDPDSSPITQYHGSVTARLTALMLVSVAASAADPRLFDAVQSRDQKTVLALLRSGADVNAARDDGSTALIWAANRDDAEIASALLRAGANPNNADENGETPLLGAAGNGNLAIAKMLVDAGANVNASRWNGLTRPCSPRCIAGIWNWFVCWPTMAPR